MSGLEDDPPGHGDEGNANQSKLPSAKRPITKIDLDGHDLPPSPAPSTPRNGKRYALATELVYTEGSDQYGASSTPIYQVRNFNCLSTFNGPSFRTADIGSSLSPCIITDDMYSRRHSSKHLALEEANMTTHAPATLPGHISRGTWPRSCPRSALWSFLQAWAP